MKLIKKFIKDGELGAVFMFLISMAMIFGIILIDPIIAHQEDYSMGVPLDDDEDIKDFDRFESDEEKSARAEAERMFLDDQDDIDENFVPEPDDDDN